LRKIKKVLEDIDCCRSGKQEAVFLVGIALGAHW
jgi:hypothetical protein